MNRRLLVLILLILPLLILTGCNTVNGLGKDVESLGRMIQGE